MPLLSLRVVNRLGPAARPESVRFVAVQSLAHAEESNQTARVRFYLAPAGK